VSKKDKLLKKLFATPPPKAFTWDELITVMTHAGFSNVCDGGSHYTFEHTTGLRISISKTHPAGLLKPYQVKAAKEAIERTGGTQENENENDKK
jgi:predicted RNA binding protein YcfA (HicA-like mRNA interferase family)